MELDELKQQWELLHQKLDEQEIVTKRLLENAVSQKIDFISGYNWIGIIIGLAVIPVVLFLGQTKQVEKELLVAITCILTFFTAFGIYKALQFNKTKSFKNDILHTEKIILRHEKLSFWYYLITLIVIFGFLIVSTFVFYERLVTYNRLWIFLVIIVFGIFAGVGEMKWYLRKIKNLQQSISDLKEFEKE